MTKKEQLTALVAHYTENEAIRAKLAAHLAELFEGLDPDAIGEAYRTALENENYLDAAKACASYYRNKPDFPLERLSGKGRYSTEAAEAILRGEMCEVNIPYTFKGEHIDFYFNPTKEKGPFNPEWMWQFNRHGFWHTLARAYSGTGDERYAKAYAVQIADWIMQTEQPETDYNGVESAWRTIECGIRLMEIWHAAFGAFRKSPNLTDITLLLIIASMHRQSVHLIAHPQRGNWLMMEKSGVYTFASLFPEYKDAEAARKLAAEVLFSELKGQILPDGMQYELSQDYQFVVYNCAAETYELARACGREEELPEEYGCLMDRMTMTFVEMSTPAFSQPRTNDCYTMYTRRMTARTENLRGKRPEFSFVNTERREGRPPVGQTASRFLPWAGFCVMRSDWSGDAVYLCFDVGPRGMAHQHADKLNINLYRGSEELIFDDGGGQYERSKLRAYAVSGYDHNTLLVDGLDQCRRLPLVSTEPIDAHWETNDRFDYARGIFDQEYATDWSPVCHTREVLFAKPGFFCVRDTILSTDEKEHSYEILFQIDTTNVHAAEGFENAVISEFGKRYDILLVPVDPHDGETRIVSGQTEPQYRGWFVGRTNLTVHEAATVSRMVKDKKDHVFTTLLFPIDRTRADAMPEISYSDGMLSVTFEGKSYRFCPDVLSEGIMKYEITG